MKCAICNEKTTWDSSYGYEKFIVCPKCFNRLSKNNPKNLTTTMDFIFICGQIRREKKELALSK
jgi:hypothetical protein